MPTVRPGLGVARRSRDPASLSKADASVPDPFRREPLSPLDPTVIESLGLDTAAISYRVARSRASWREAESSATATLQSRHSQLVIRHCHCHCQCRPVWIWNPRSAHGVDSQRWDRRAQLAWVGTCEWTAEGIPGSREERIGTVDAILS